MLKASGAMAAATLASRILGMVREMVYGYFMGTTRVASAFLLAFQIPNLFRRLLGEGALTAAFIPIFKEKERSTAQNGRELTRGPRVSDACSTRSSLAPLAALRFRGSHLESRSCRRSSVG